MVSVRAQGILQEVEELPYLYLSLTLALTPFDSTIKTSGILIQKHLQYNFDCDEHLSTF